MDLTLVKGLAQQLANEAFFYFYFFPTLKAEAGAAQCVDSQQGRSMLTGKVAGGGFPKGKPVG